MTTTYGPVRIVGESHRQPVCVTVGNRVMAAWQRYGYMLGNATVLGFERDPDGWIKVVVETDVLEDDGYRVERWDWDRTLLCAGHWDDETQDESVTRWREFNNARVSA